MKIHLLFSFVIALTAAIPVAFAMENRIGGVCSNCMSHNNEPNPVHYACTRQHIDCLNNLLQQELRWFVQRTWINSQEPGTGWSPLHKACLFAHVNAVQALIVSGANVNLQDTHGLTPLMWACVNLEQNARQKLDIIEILCQQPNLDVHILDEKGGTALSYVNRTSAKQ